MESVSFPSTGPLPGSRLKHWPSCVWHDSHDMHHMLYMCTQVHIHHAGSMMTLVSLQHISMWGTFNPPVPRATSQQSHCQNTHPFLNYEQFHMYQPPMYHHPDCTNVHHLQICLGLLFNGIKVRELKLHPILSLSPGPETTSY